MTAKTKQQWSVMARWLGATTPLLLFATLLFLTLRDHSLMLKLFAEASYYFLVTIVLVWTYFVARYVRARDLNLALFLKDHAMGLVTAGILTALVFISVEPGFRVLSDETNLIAVSKALLFEKKALNTTMGKWQDDAFWPIHHEVPKRPLLFPFCVYLLHALFGYSYGNAFLFNGLILFVMLSMAYVIGKNVCDWKAGVALMLLLTAQPVITLSATSAGFDFFSAVFYAIVVLSLYGFMRTPTPEGFALLWVNLVMFGNIRYESVIYVPIIVTFLALFRVLKTSHWSAYPALYACTPLLFLPRIWQTILKQGNYENPEGVPLFGVQHFVVHLTEMVVGFFDFRFFLPYATLFNLFAVVAFLVLSCGVVAGKVHFPQRFHARFGLIALVMLGTNLVIVLSHHGGHYMHPTQARGFLVLSIALALAPLALTRFLSVPSSRTLVVIALLTFFLYHPVAVEGRFTSALTLIRETRLVHDFLATRDTKRIILIVDRPGQYTVLNMGSVDFNYANAHSEELLRNLREHVVEEIYVVQKIRYDGGEGIVPEYRLDVGFRLETLKEVRNEPNLNIRISRVTRPAEK